MNKELLIASVGIVCAPAAEAIIEAVEHWPAFPLLKLPSIALGACVAYMLYLRTKASFVLAYIWLGMGAFGNLLVVALIGGTSSFYPGWKLSTLAAIGLICLISLIALAKAHREQVNKKQPKAS